MPKLICTVGLQGSGKSTWAREYMATHNNTYRVNGDEVRAMLYTGKWDRHKEAVVQNCQATMVESLLKNQMNVVWDNMNLSNAARERCKKLAAATGAELVWHEMKTTLDQCICNDSQRVSSQGLIGRAIIENTALRYGLIEWNKYRQLVLVDIDGTLTDCEWRRKLYLDSAENKCWDRFLSRCDEDNTVPAIVKWVNALSVDYDIVLVSGRQEELYEQKARTDLQLAGVLYKRIFMRKNGDHRPDWQVKLDIIKHIPKEQIEFAIDDRPVVIEKVWRANGIKVFPIGGYDHEW
jgi:predicted kinase